MEAVVLQDLSKIYPSGKKAVNRLCLSLAQGEVFGFLGPNGAGKSTLGYALMGNPNYMATQGSIRFDGKDITEEAADKRAKEGIFLSFQNPLEVHGQTGHIVFSFCHRLTHCMPL